MPLMDGFTLLCGEQRNLDALADWLNIFAACRLHDRDRTRPLAADGRHFYHALRDKAPLPLRVFNCQYIAHGDRMTLACPVDQGDDRFAIIGTKMWGDGSVLLGNVGVSRPYLNTEMTLQTRMGLPQGQQGLAQLRAGSAGTASSAPMRAQGRIQMSVHAQGDRTIDVVLDARESALIYYHYAQATVPPGTLRFMRDDQIARAIELGVIIAVSSSQCSTSGKRSITHGLVGEDWGLAASAAGRQRGPPGHAGLLSLRCADDLARSHADAARGHDAPNLRRRNSQRPIRLSTSTRRCARSRSTPPTTSAPRTASAACGSENTPTSSSWPRGTRAWYAPDALARSSRCSQPVEGRRI